MLVFGVFYVCLGVVYVYVLYAYRYPYDYAYVSCVTIYMYVRKCAPQASSDRRSDMCYQTTNELEIRHPPNKKHIKDMCFS